MLNIGLVLFGSYHVLRYPREPRAMLVWLLTFLLLPALKVMLFFLLSDPRLRRRQRRLTRRRQRINPELWRHLNAVHERYAPIFEAVPNPAPLRRFIDLSTRINNERAPTAQNAVLIYHHQAPQLWQDLLQALESACSHIHLEYFTFRPDASGQRIAAILKDKARAGVRCRLLADHVGSWGWPTAFAQSLLDAGVDVAFFMPVIPWRNQRWRLRLNFRNHRKLAVIDGRVAFTGSQNIGDEYFGADKSIQDWIDTHLRLSGPAVHELQEIFVEDWHFATGEDLYDPMHFPTPDSVPDGQGRIVQIIPSGPDYDARIMHHLLLAAISAAERTVRIASPYFVPDPTMVLSLETAAYRGVRVQLLVPAWSDHRIALWAGRSYYRELLEAGIEVFEYQSGFLHSKLVIVDENWAMIGSANMDERSFRLNFELTTVLYAHDTGQQMRAEFDAMLQQAQHIDPTHLNRSLGESLLLGLARVASPMY
jgi:cardiolipin synthase